MKRFYDYQKNNSFENGTVVNNGVNGAESGANGLKGRDAVIKCIAIDSHISIAEIVKETGIPRRTVDRLINI